MNRHWLLTPKNFSFVAKKLSLFAFHLKKTTSTNLQKKWDAFICLPIFFGYIVKKLWNMYAWNCAQFVTTLFFRFYRRSSSIWSSERKVSFNTAQFEHCAHRLQIITKWFSVENYQLCKARKSCFGTFSCCFFSLRIPSSVRTKLSFPKKPSAKINQSKNFGRQTASYSTAERVWNSHHAPSIRHTGKDRWGDLATGRHTA